jgi:hypothetical protein
MGRIAGFFENLDGGFTNFHIWIIKLRDEESNGPFCSFIGSWRDGFLWIRRCGESAEVISCVESNSLGA